MGSTSKAFPAAVWPLNRSEAGIGCAALVPAGLAGSVALIPALSTPGDRRADAASVHWHPASFQHGLRTHGLLSEPRPPVTLRPPTRTPGFLKQAECPPYYRMVYNFRRAHGDLDIPHELLATAFQEAEADGGWDNIPSMKGGVVAVCRPALGDRWPPNPPPNAGETGGSAEDNLRGLRFKRDIKPALATRARAEGDDGDSEAASEPGVWSSRREWAMYASGECGNELWALPLPLPDDGAHAFPSLRRCGSAIPDATAAEVAPSIEFTTPIRQVAAHSSHPGAVCVRTDSMVAIVGLSQCHRGPNWTPYVSADVVGHPYSYDSGDRWTCHASWSPWRATEIALASGTGSVRLWDCAAGREVLLKDAEQAGSYDIQWNCCEFWNSPRHLLCANPDALYFLDARAGRTQTAIMSLPESPFALSGEAFTAICPSALHPLHAVAASTHAIRVFDQRYPKQPVMAWEHGSTPADPPIYLQSSRLPNYADGHAACILAATEKSSRIYCYVYGQGGSDQPYTSLDQSVLRPAAHASTVYETIQDALAIDPQRSEDMTSAYTHIAEYPTARLAGFSLSFMAPVDGTDAGVAGTRAPADSVCVSVDELGAVVGHHVVVAPSASTGNGFKAPASAHSGLLYSGVWNAAREVDGTIIDGMNLVLRERRSTDGTREATWAELRKRSEAYIRTDMSQAYRGLLEHVARAPPEIGYPPLSAAEGEALRRRIPSITSRDTSAYERGF
ncbi:TATA box-binding protein-associated factor RNA polymerase I subunit C [Coemansia biformis]|uniref:TATA box-binding protein-associated factor RNA polymerase I subunit C n=1 Tax=Coemansia biformis TaxID=1286918 RepID=A0A9W8D0C5_9FUNG|nr:TATA box-binding protein-associated factor RNA polymerase I subunit C [Coemansia biformis]